MRTAQEMYDYCLQNGYGSGFNETWALEHFSLIEESLQLNEEIKMCFIGLHNYISLTKHDGNVAYAITNKRIILAKKKLFGKVIQTVSLNTINDITFSAGILRGIILFDTAKEKFNVALNKEFANNIFMKAHEVVELAKAPAQTIIVGSSFSSADEILKLKNLLDMGLITQEDFDKKKKELL